MNVNLLFFATFKDLAGTRRLELELPAGATVGDLRGSLGVRFPKMIPALGSALVSINKEFAFPEDVIPPDAEVALFPPVSGG
jgi:molybdopterin converting factor subunit 1